MTFHCPLQAKGKKVSTCEEAAGTVGSMATCNAPNQEAFRIAGALPLLLELVLTAERPIKARARPILLSPPQLIAAHAGAQVMQTVLIGESVSGSQAMTQIH